MSQSLEFILDRAHETHSVMAQIAATWTWDEITPVAYLAALTALETQRDTTQDQENDVLTARGLLDTHLDDMHERTVQFVGMAKARYRTDAGKMNVLNGLAADGQSRGDIIDQGNAAKIAWANIADTWSPTTTNTLTAFTALLATCTTNLDDWTDKKDLHKQSSGKLRKMANDLEEISQAWYAAATRAFKEGTPDGDLIRTIPTTTQVTEPPDKAEISSATKPAAFTARLVYDAKHASKFNIFQKSPGFTEFGIIANNREERNIDVVLQDGPGAYQFKVVGINDEGEGDASDVKTLTYP